jgi:hypothetical protein
MVCTSQRGPSASGAERRFHACLTIVPVIYDMHTSIAVRGGAALLKPLANLWVTFGAGARTWSHALSFGVESAIHR